MIRLDSIKLQVSNEVINSFGSSFISSQSADTNGVILTDKLTLNNTGYTGFKSFITDRKTNSSTLEVSAKILGTDYIEGINQNTIQQALETVNKTKHLDINVNRFLDIATVLRCDVTNNIKPEVFNETFYKTLAALPIAKKYHIDLFNTKRNLGVVYKGNQKTVRDRIIFYDKTLDIIRDKEFRNSPYANKLYNDFKGVVRVESNHSQFKALNKHFGDRNLLTVLKSPVKLNYNVFSRITDKTTDVNLALFNQFEGMKFSAIRGYLGDKGIIELCNNDWQQIELFIKVYNTNNYRHFKKHIRTVYNTITAQQSKTDLNIINHIKQLLNEAA